MAALASFARRRLPPLLSRPTLHAACGHAAARPLGARNILEASAVGTVVQVSSRERYEVAMYGRERQLLVHVVSSAKEGDSDAVLAAMDDFWAHHFGMRGTDSWSVRKDMLDAAVREKSPHRALELGTYCGYSALRIARGMPSIGRLASIEVDPLFGAIATKIIEYAGLGHKVKVLTGTVETKLDSLTKFFTPPDAAPEAATPKLDFVLCDHSKERFIPDLEILERALLIGPGTVVMGDTTVYPGEDSNAGGKDLLTYFAVSKKFRVQRHVGTDKSAGITVCEWPHLV